MNPAQTVAKLEAMREQVSEVASNYVTVNALPATVYAVTTLAKAVDALTYVVIEQLRELPKDRGLKLELMRIYDNGSADLLVNGELICLGYGSEVFL